MRRLTLRAHLNFYSGYGNAVVETFNALTRLGIFVSVRATAIDEQWGVTSKIPTLMRSQIVSCRQPEPWEFVFCTPDTAPTPGKRSAIWTMFESSTLPPDYVRNLNRYELVITPCQWCKECFEESGVKAPIEIIPLAYNPEIFTPSPVRMEGPTIFGVAGRTKHCSKRKAVQEAIDLFLKTFPSDDDVRLHVKVHPDDDAKSTDPRVKISKAHFEPYELALWLSNLTAYLTLAKAEGAGLWPMQAMACGRPVIGMKYAGQADFLSEANSYVIPHREVEAGSDQSNVKYLGLWGEPKLKEAAQLMQRVRSNREEAGVIGSAGQKWIEHWTWERSAMQLVMVLEKYGAL